LANNPNVSDADLRVQRAALSKAVNSLSWKPRMIIPRRSTPPDAVRPRLRDWMGQGQPLERNPQAVSLRVAVRTTTDAELRDIDQELERETKTKIPFIRADWSWPPRRGAAVPHALANSEDGGRAGKATSRGRDRQHPPRPAARCGFGKRVSQQNRWWSVTNRSTDYWKSYDFKPARRKATWPVPARPRVPRQPVRPVGVRTRRRRDYLHLPNGLQGYMLIDGKDNRIDQGPEDVVFDSQNTLGSPAS